MYMRENNEILKK